MKLVKYRVFPVWAFDKEEQWLNHMADQGWVLDSVKIFKYTFVKSEPGEYTIRMELLEKGVTTNESKAYLEFLAETGAEHITSVLDWIYLKKRTDQGPFDLFSDRESRVKHLDRILKFLGIFALLELGIGLFSGVTNTDGDYQLSWILIFIGLLFSYGYYLLWQKKKQLLADQDLFE